MQNANKILNRLKDLKNIDSDADLAKYLEKDPSTISTWRRRDALDYNLILAKCQDEDLNYLFFGSEFKKSSNIVTELNLNYSKSPIPYYKSVVASAGNGIIPEEEEDVIYIALPTPFIHQELATTPKDLFIMQITGDSMEPTIKHSSIIIVNRNHHPPYAGQIYLVRLGESLLCKRIHEMPGHKLNVISDNKRYQDFEIQLNDDFEVIGKVVWKVERSI